jgi:hypothetical protein
MNKEFISQKVNLKEKTKVMMSRMWKLCLINDRDGFSLDERGSYQKPDCQER